MISYTEYIAATIDIKKLLTPEKLDSIYSKFNVHDESGITVKGLKASLSKFGIEKEDQ